MSLKVRTTVEIAAPPSEVREKFFDFSSWSSWSKNGPVKSVSFPTPNVQPGDKIDVELNSGTKFSPVLVENNDTTLSWRGSLLGIFAGTHYFRFEESKVTPGHTTFVHGEDFSGALVWLGSWYPGIQQKADNHYLAQGEEFKAWVEGGAGSDRAKL